MVALIHTSEHVYGFVCYFGNIMVIPLVEPLPYVFRLAIHGVVGAYLVHFEVVRL
jgi:hypothetical protein